MRKAKKGFTLIELLVVIAIIAILSVVVILTLNPAELLRQSRDSNRISDMSVLKSAIGYYLATAPIPVLGTSTIGVCYQSAAPVGNGSSTCSWFPSASTTVLFSSSTQTNGSGWIPVNFSSLTGGSPLGALPQDPLYASGNYDNIHFYAYTERYASSTFKIDAHMESIKYGITGGGNVVSTDGGTDPNSYEQGTDLTL